GYAIGGARVGDVVRAGRGGAIDRYVVLRDGLQPVPATMADLITYSGAGQGRRVRDLPAAAVAGAPVTRSPLPVDGFPAQPPDVRGAAPAVLCATWGAPAEGGDAERHVLAGGRLPTGRPASDVRPAGPAGPDRKSTR